ncbi:putative harbinger transposase-derived protein [Tanacetum coccineum]
MVEQIKIQRNTHESFVYDTRNKLLDLIEKRYGDDIAKEKETKAMMALIEKYRSTTDLMPLRQKHLVGEDIPITAATSSDVAYFDTLYVVFLDGRIQETTAADIQKTYELHEQKHGLPRMLGSIDCMHREWRNCPKALHGQFKRKDHKYPNLMLEAVADQKLWNWHAYFGVPEGK